MLMRLDYPNLNRVMQSLGEEVLIREVKQSKDDSFNLIYETTEFKALGSFQISSSLSNTGEDFEAPKSTIKVYLKFNTPVTVPIKDLERDLVTWYMFHKGYAFKLNSIEQYSEYGLIQAEAERWEDVP